MAAKTVNKSSIVCSRIPKAGWMTIGKSSSGTNQNAQVTFPALGISDGIITQVDLYMPWDNDAANEGFQAGTTHQATVGGNVYDYHIEGRSGTAQVVLAAGWSNTTSFVVDLRGKSSNSNSTSKGYSQNPYIVVTYTPYTPPTAPANLSQSPNPFETALRLSWTRGSDGTNNPITGYDVRYQTSNDGSNWSSETSVIVSASAEYYDIPSSTISGWERGMYVRFRVGSVSAYFSTVYSDYSSSVRKNRAPAGTATSLSASPSPYISGNLSISFTAGSDPDNGVSGYHTKYQESADGASWGGDVGLPDVGASSPWTTNLASYGVQGRYYRFYMQPYDPFGVAGPWSSPSNAVQYNAPPLTPTINCPVAGGTVYNRTPRILCTAAAANDGPKHTLKVKGARGTYMSTDVSYTPAVFSCGVNDTLASQRKVVFRSNVTDDTVVGSNTFYARMYDGTLYSNEASRQFNVATLTFTDPNLSAPNMRIRAVHVTELQTAINTLRAAYGLGAVSWKTVTPNVTKIADVTIIEQMQQAVAEIISKINGWDSGSTTLDISVTWVSPVEGEGVSGAKLRQAIEQLRALLPAI